MAGNKLLKIITKQLITNYAYSIVASPDHNGIVIRYNVPDISPLKKECAAAGIEIGEGELSHMASDMLQEMTSISKGMIPMNALLKEREFLVGECLHIALANRDELTVLKVEPERWWVMDATGTVAEYKSRFVYFEGEFASGRTIRMDGMDIEIESLNFYTSTELSRRMDFALSPSFHKTAYDGISMEELLIVPAYHIVKNLKREGEVDIKQWIAYLKKATDHSIDCSTAWMVANAVVDNFELLY